MSYLFFRRRRKVTSLLTEAENQEITLRTNDQNLLKKLSLISFNENDLRILKTLYPIIEENMGEVVKGFYDTILKIPELKQLIEKHSSVERLQSVLFPHLLELFSGVIDESFVEKRLRVANIHYQIGLEPAWYLASFQEIQNSLINIITNNVPDSKEWGVFICSVTRILNVEQQLVLEAYGLETKQGMENSFQEGREAIQRNVLAVSDSLVGSSEEANHLINMLVHSSDEVNMISTSGHEQAVATKDTGVTGKETLEDFLRKIVEIANQVENMNEIVQRVEQSSGEITNVVKIVEDIAEQTNLLALNSAIEAARAGEYGKGFAVVADEVRNLADQTKDSISTINELVEASGNYTKELVESLQEMTEDISESNQMSRDTYGDFEEIIKAMDNNLQTNTHIQEQVNSQNDALNEIEQVMDSVVKSANELQEIVS